MVNDSSTADAVVLTDAEIAAAAKAERELKQPVPRSERRRLLGRVRQAKRPHAITKRADPLRDVTFETLAPNVLACLTALAKASQEYRDELDIHVDALPKYVLVMIMQDHFKDRMFDKQKLRESAETYKRRGQSDTWPSTSERIRRWRGAGYLGKGKLDNPAHVRWLEKLPGMHLYRLTDEALLLIKEGNYLRERTRRDKLSYTSRRNNAMRAAGLFAPGSEVLIARAVKTYDEGVTLQELGVIARAAGSKVQDKSLSAYAARLVDRGILERIARGVYVVPEGGTDRGS